MLLAAWIPLSAPRRVAAPIAIGLVVVFAAGAASIRHWAPPSAPPATSAAAANPLLAQQAPPAAAATPPDAAPGSPPTPGGPPLDRAREVEQPGWEEIERRHAAAARIRKWIEAGPNATGSAVGEGLLAEGKPHPVYQDGALRGIALQDLRPDGFYARLGLREGDLVESINGIGLADSGALLREIAGSGTLELEVERSDGAQDQISLPREQILEGLKGLE